MPTKKNPETPADLAEVTTTPAAEQPTRTPSAVYEAGELTLSVYTHEGEDAKTHVDVFASDPAALPSCFHVYFDSEGWANSLAVELLAGLTTRLEAVQR